MPKYAFAHPGKIGDAVYALPLIKYICERDGAEAHFYTSSYCASLKRFFMHQKEITDFIVPENYQIRDFGCGGQPWQMPIDSSQYDRVFQCGFPHHPPNGPLHEFIARNNGVDPNLFQPHHFIWEALDINFIDKPFIAMCGKTPEWTEIPAYRYLIEHSPIATVQIGLPHEWLGGKSINLTGLDILETVSILKSTNCKAFVGYMSSPLTYANGVPGLHRFATLPSPGAGSEHGIYGPYNHYIVKATGAEILNILGLT